MRTLLTALLVILFLASCKDAKRPVFEDVENLKVGTPGINETPLTAGLRFSNPNSFGARLKAMNCSVYVDSVYLGKFTNLEPVRLQANKSFVLPLTGQVVTLVMMQQSMKAMSGKESIILVEGRARVGRAGFYKTIPFSYSDTLVLTSLLPKK
jgi:LEA14-like dessication related protein